MDVEPRTADLDLDPELDTPHVAVSTGQVTRMVDVVADLRALVRSTRPGGLVGVAALANLDQVEPFAFYAGALLTTVPDLAGPPLTAAAFRLADPALLHRRLEQAGLDDVHVEPITRRVRFDSARGLLDAVTRSDPIGAQRLGELTAQQASDVERVLDGMFRERSGGNRGAVLRTVINVGSARIARPTVTTNRPRTERTRSAP